MSAPITVRFAYSDRDHLEALRQSRSALRLRLWLKVCAALMGAIAVGVAVVGVTIAGSSLPEVLSQTLPLLGLAGVWLLAERGVYRGLVWYHRREHEMREGDAVVRSFAADGFAPTERWSRPIPWAHVASLEETARYFQVYAVDGPYYVPKASLTGAEDVALRELFRANLADRPRTVRLLSRAT